MRPILEILPVRLAIAAEVKQKEVLIAPSNDPDDTLPDESLDELIEMGLLQEVDFTSEDEATTVVDLAALGLDMGEAISGAIAIHRNWAIATDDNRAIRVLRTRNESIRIITTPEIIHFWANHAGPDGVRVGQVLMSIETMGHFCPKTVHPLFDWWQKHRGNEQP